jgi:hypothetical protein
MTNKVEQLIAIVKKYPIRIYDMTLPEFKDMKKKIIFLICCFVLQNININK